MKVTILKDSIFFENSRTIGNIFLVKCQDGVSFFTSHNYHNKQDLTKGRQTRVDFKNEDQARKFFNRLASALKNS